MALRDTKLAGEGVSRRSKGTTGGSSGRTAPGAGRRGIRVLSRGGGGGLLGISGEELKKTQTAPASATLTVASLPTVPALTPQPSQQDGSECATGQQGPERRNADSKHRSSGFHFRTQCARQNTRTETLPIESATTLSPVPRCRLPIPTVCRAALPRMPVVSARFQPFCRKPRPHSFFAA